MSSETESASDGASGPDRYGLSVEQFQQIVAAGIIPQHERIELIAGSLYRRPQVGARQAYLVKHLIRVLSRHLPDGYHVQSRLPVALWGSQLEPDIAVVGGSPDDYRLRIPVVSEVPLIIEVAERNSLAIRLGQQMSALAADQVEAYWVVDTEESEIVVHYDGQPVAGGPPRFSTVQRYRGSEAFPLRLSGWTVRELRPDELIPG